MGSTSSAARKPSTKKGSGQAAGKAASDAPISDKTRRKYEVIVPGDGMPLATRNKKAPKATKIAKARAGILKIGDVTLPINGTIDHGVHGAMYKIVKLTPDKARALLKRVPKGQRGLRVDHVRAIANDMRADRFRWTGEPIRIDKDGMLIDGQHRMAAAVRADYTFEGMMLCLVLKKASIASIDEGAKRNIRDRRAILGKRAIEYSVIASVAYERSNWNNHSSRGLSNEEKDALIDAISYLPEIETIQQVAKRTYGNLDSALAAVAIRCFRIHRKEARLFFTAISENSHSPSGRESKQIKAACNHLMQMAAAYREGRGDGDTRRRREQTTWKLIHAWNAWINKRQLPTPWRYVKSKIPDVL